MEGISPPSLGMEGISPPSGRKGHGAVANICPYSSWEGEFEYHAGQFTANAASQPPSLQSASRAVETALQQGLTAVEVKTDSTYTIKVNM